MLINIEGYYDIEFTDSVKNLLSQENLANLTTLFESNAPFVVCLNYFTSLNLEEKLLKATNYKLDNFNFLLQYYIMAQKIIAKTKYNENLKLQKKLKHLQETVDDTHVLDFAQMKLSQVSQEIELAEHKFPPAEKNPDAQKQADVEKEYGKDDEVTIKTTKNEEEEHDSGTDTEVKTLINPMKKRNTKQKKEIKL